MGRILGTLRIRAEVALNDVNTCYKSLHVITCFRYIVTHYYMILSVCQLWNEFSLDTNLR